MRKIKKKLRTTKVTIERIFHDIVKRRMTPAERRILLGAPKKNRKPN